MTTIKRAGAAGEGERDEPPGAGVSLRRIDEKPLPMRPSGGDAGAAFRIAARSLMRRGEAAPRPRKRVKTGGDDKGGKRYAARSLAADYLKLCHDPVKDLRRWLAEDKKKAGGTGRRFQPTRREGHDHAQDAKQTRVAEAHGLRSQSLPDMRGGLDADGKRGRDADGVPARPRACAGGYDGLRPVRGEGTGLASRSGIASAQGLSFAGEGAGIRALYGAKIEATRRSLPAREIAAAVRALLDEQRAAFRALAERRQAETAARPRDESIPSKPTLMV
ncbi:hypothetical protein [Methylocapsa aurea]|uniref:hypothetical protein n=1 Tax=Methylocapsa aurea TaxID=663610 RepID=UPI0012EBA231|nr:hypothetical protein [Methylocapsa aurea]